MSAAKAKSAVNADADAQAAKPAVCLLCKKPLRWEPQGQLSRYAADAERTQGTTPEDKSVREWAKRQREAVEQYRATHRRGYLGAGHFCGQQCAAHWAHNVASAVECGALRFNYRNGFIHKPDPAAT